MKRAHSQLRTRAAAWLLVLAWLGAMPGMLPMIFAVFAASEGSHDVELESRATEICVVLTHHAQCGMSHDAIHQHGVLARALASATTDDNDGPDHVMHFTNAQNGPAEKRTAALHPPETVGTAVPDALPANDFLPPRPELARVWPATISERPLAQLAAIRSTLLLI